MSTAARVLAQAKVNLLLHVLDREASGYHGIETVFLRLELGDDVCVRITPGKSLDCTGPAVPPDGLGPARRNLAFRAASAYADATGWPNGFAIEVTKRIPVGGGLGGGSADAGAVLRALDALSPHPLGQRLVSLATMLGADVPFMTIESAMAAAWGRGERLLPVRPLESRSALLIVPRDPISTADAYAWLTGDRGTYTPAANVLSLDALGEWSRIAALARNDFERVVARRRPEIAELVDELRAAGADIAMLSGSGSTVFGIFAEPPDAARVTHS
ncbi:MAG TPA: 4-(cytidine 5'-diphospho)-2-C-methyl-D-erythritol kinase, partial [Gemmatimonadaceae bacterium]|nr:4-(cytidine 5'-diphospho)-2-C-methyl-D-erythritol kinase [Gemmatimonadaceae bacterium]